MTHKRQRRKVTNSKEDSDKKVKHSFKSSKN